MHLVTPFFFLKRNRVVKAFLFFFVKQLSIAALVFRRVVLSNAAAIHNAAHLSVSPPSTNVTTVRRQTQA